MLSLRAQRVLIVDDNQDAAITLSIMMSMLGHVTKTAFDGPEALVVAEDFHPDIVLLDIGLPTLSGYEVCRALRARHDDPPFVIVAVSGWGQSDDRRKSSEAGFDAHLVKPVAPELLFRTLRELTAVPAHPASAPGSFDR